MPSLEYFSDRLKLLLFSNKLKQGELAIALNVSQPHISSILNNKTQPSRELVSKAAKYFKCREEWLVYGTGSMNKEEVIQEEVTSELTIVINQIRKTYNELESPAERYELIGNLFMALGNASNGKKVGN
jgi:transcriptional regulator with XRE-family HTH domain